jgi:adenylyl-sulfate kinase
LEGDLFLNMKGFTVWFTGLSASGKSTATKHLESKLANFTRSAIYVIDGDHFRKTINKDLGYTREERNIASERIAHVAKILNDNGVICLVSNISQDKNIRNRVRNIIKNFVLVFLDTPLEVCAKRDFKGNYKKAMNGEMDNFVGITEEYEKPDNAEITIDTLSCDPEEAARKVIQYLIESGKVRK